MLWGFTERAHQFIRFVKRFYFVVEMHNNWNLNATLSLLLMAGFESIEQAVIRVNTSCIKHGIYYTSFVFRSSSPLECRYTWWLVTVTLWILTFTQRQKMWNKLKDCAEIITANVQMIILFEILGLIGYRIHKVPKKVGTGLHIRMSFHCLGSKYHSMLFDTILNSSCLISRCIYQFQTILSSTPLLTNVIITTLDHCKR